MKVLILVLIAVAIVVLAPFATIWSLNTLFPALAIPFNFDTWLATVVLGGVVGGGTGITRSK